MQPEEHFNGLLELTVKVSLPEGEVSRSLKSSLLQNLMHQSLEIRILFYPMQW